MLISLILSGCLANVDVSWAIHNMEHNVWLIKLEIRVHLNVMLELFLTPFKKDAWHVQMVVYLVTMFSPVEFVVLISTSTQHRNFVHSFVEMVKDTSLNVMMEMSMMEMDVHHHAQLS